MKAKTSIIIPFYNGEKYFENLVISIFKSIELVENNFVFQIIVIIDSMETSLDFINDILFKYFSNLRNTEILVKKNSLNMGVAKSRNFGLAIANGDIIHLIDQDDTIEPYLYTLVLSKIDSFNFILVNGNVHYTNPMYNKHKLYYFKQDLSLKGLIFNDFIRSPGQVVFRRELISYIVFPEPIIHKGADDHFFWISIFFKNRSNIKPFYCNQVLYNALIHSDNYSSDQINLRKSSLENWDIFLRENKINKILLIAIYLNIYSLRFSASIKQSTFNNLLGFVTRMFYFMDLNKMVRYIFKRVNTSFTSY